MELAITNLAVAYNDRVLFSDISARFKPGDVVCVVGPSGVGKSTLLKAIIGAVDAAGTVKLKDSKRKLGMAMVTQQPNLWAHFTSIDNIAIVRKVVYDESIRISRERAREWMEILDVANIARRYPFSLSGGEQQRVSLARGFAADPEVLLLDEVTSNVDGLRKKIICDAIRRFGRSRVVILATHDLDVVEQIATRVLSFENGQCVQRI